VSSTPYLGKTKSSKHLSSSKVTLYLYDLCKPESLYSNRSPSSSDDTVYLAQLPQNSIGEPSQAVDKLNSYFRAKSNLSLHPTRLVDIGVLTRQKYARLNPGSVLLSLTPPLLMLFSVVLSLAQNQTYGLLSPNHRRPALTYAGTFSRETRDQQGPCAEVLAFELHPSSLFLHFFFFL
jgi:hypothetical protein